MTVPAAWERARLMRCIARCDSLQGRVATRRQIHLPPDFPQRARWVELLTGLWRDGFADWKVRNHSGEMVALCRLGPPE